MDKFLEVFVKNFGQPNVHINVPENYIVEYSDILPDCLISYWKEFGWSSFSNGLFWFTNPEDFSEIVRDWVDGFEELKGYDYFVFARSGFGNLYAWCPNNGRVIRIACATGYVMANKKFSISQKNKSEDIQFFIGASLPKDYDFIDTENLPLFNRAVESLGSLSSDEVYGFAPLLALGGAPILENVRRFRMDVHLDIMRQFADPVLRMV